MADYLGILFHANGKRVEGISCFSKAAPNFSVHSVPYILVDMVPHYFRVTTILCAIYQTSHHKTIRDHVARTIDFNYFDSVFPRYSRIFMRRSHHTQSNTRNASSSVEVVQSEISYSQEPWTHA